MELIEKPKNKGGRPPSVWQEPRLRADYLAQKYSSDQIIAFAKAIAAGEKTPLSQQDCIVAINLANIYEMRSGEERERLYNRIFGKVPDKAININLNLDATPEQLGERARAIMSTIAPIEIESEAIDDNSDLIEE